MTSRHYRSETWMDSRQDLRPSPIHGIGTFARHAIHRGEVVETFGGRCTTDAEFRTFQQATLRFNAVQIDEDVHLVEHPEISERRTGSLNHACDSNLWMADEVTVVARRDIAPDEELTVDYALFSAQSDWVMDPSCQCGMPMCRGIIMGDDWKHKGVQARYLDHFSPFLNARIATLRADARHPEIR